MSTESKTSVWHVSLPSAWPKVPLGMSFSTLSELEACPRRWALSTGNYPNIWKQRGYPRPLIPVAIEGTIVHYVLQRIMSALVKNGCPSLLDEGAVLTLRELGGYTAIIVSCIERTLQTYQGNPRAAPFLDDIQHRLLSQTGELRSRVQKFISRIHIESCAARSRSSKRYTKEESRYRLQNGSHAEVELRASELGWFGVADLLTLSTTFCEIRDFKTGTSKQEHEDQIRTYALLWARDSNLNPSGRFADKLVLSYNDGDVEVQAPKANALRSLENELRERTAVALNAIQTNPPEARPNPENCVYCTVRHICEEYWLGHASRVNDIESSKGQFTDLQIKLTGQHGPSSWDGVVESSLDVKTNRRILLRTANLRFDLHPGEQLRLLNVHLSIPNEESIEDEHPPVVATMGASSETFLI